MHVARRSSFVSRFAVIGISRAATDAISPDRFAHILRASHEAQTGLGFGRQGKLFSVHVEFTPLPIGLPPIIHPILCPPFPS